MTERAGEKPMIRRWEEETEGGGRGYLQSTSADQCNSCLRRARDLSLRCEAFPDRMIPIEILDGSFDHNRRHPGDHGIRRLHGEPSWEGGSG
jgi:hypothetical protein